MQVIPAVHAESGGLSQGGGTKFRYRAIAQAARTDLMQVMAHPVAQVEAVRLSRAESPMSAWYPWIVLLHLSCAIVFAGAVAFEVLVLESLHRHFDVVVMQRIEQAVMARVRRFMPVVVIALFVSGGLLFDIRCDGVACVGSRFGNWLLLKVLLAFGVLGVFVDAMWAMRRGRMDLCRFRHTHRIVLGLMAGIVFLAKTMFYL